MSFTYNDEGIRTSKTVNGVKHTYYLVGSTIMAEEWEDKLLVYLYDSAGSPIGMMFRKTSYDITVWDVFWYEKNLQGDIIAIYTSSGIRIATYAYDAWGSCVTTYFNGGAYSAAQYNPFRYRGYYYDTELGMYYLQSRYYDPVIGRFISPDSTAVLTATPMALTDKNLYAYCDNNPVMRVDEDGEFWVTVGIMAIGGVIGGVVSAISSAVIQQAVNGEVNWASIGVAAATGFVSGAIAASPLGLVGQMVAGGIVGGASYIADSCVNDTEITIDGVLLSVGMGVASGRIGGNGTNNKMLLTNTIHSTKDTIAREMRRANQKYAQKAIANALSNRNNTIAVNTWISSARFVAGTSISNVVNSLYNNSRIPDWMSYLLGKGK